MASFDDDYTIQGWPSNDLDAHVNRGRVTVNRLQPTLRALDTRAWGAMAVTDDAVEAGSTTTVINATSHSARVGDQILFVPGSNFQGRVFTVEATTANTITVAQTAPSNFVNTDGFRILRPCPPVLSNNGSSFIDLNWYYTAQNGNSVVTIEDNPSASQDALVKVACVREDTLTNNTSTTGDYHQFKANVLGALYSCNVPDSNGVHGYSSTRLISLASTNATVVKASAGALHGFEVTNINAAFRWFKIYNKATAPTVGTDSPLRTIGLPPNQTVIVNYNAGLSCSAGIGFALTTGIADTDTGAVAANEIAVNIIYK